MPDGPIHDPFCRASGRERVYCTDSAHGGRPGGDPRPSEGGAADIPPAGGRAPEAAGAGGGAAGSGGGGGEGGGGGKSGHESRGWENGDEDEEKDEEEEEYDGGEGNDGGGGGGGGKQQQPLALIQDGRIAIDVETTGTDPACQLTCVCAWDGRSGLTWYFRDADERERSKAEISFALDGAPLLLAYNGAHFDLPVIARCLGLEDRLGGWMRKLVDPLYAARALQRSTVQKLSLFLELNALPSKSGSGELAVIMAREGRWAELGSYCMDDTRLTFDAISYGKRWTAELRFDPWHCADRIFILKY